MSAEDKFVIKKRYLFWLSAFIALFYVFYQIKSVLLPFAISFIIVVFFNGIVNKLEKAKIPRALSAGIITSLIFGFVIYILTAGSLFTYSKATSGIKLGNFDYLSNIVAKAIADVNAFLLSNGIKTDLNVLANEISGELTASIKRFVSGIFSNGKSMVSTLVLFALTPIITFMMLKDAKTIKTKFFGLLPKSVKKETQQLAKEMQDSVFRFIEGQTIAAIVLAVMYSFILAPIGLEHFIILGVIIGFSSFIPYVGFYTAVFITLFSTQHQFHSINTTIIVLCLLLAGQIVDSGFITPKIVGDRLKVHPLWVIFGVLISVPLFGIVGVLLALPMIGVISVLVRFAIKKYKGSTYYNK